MVIRAARVLWKRCLAVSEVEQLSARIQELLLELGIETENLGAPPFNFRLVRVELRSREEVESLLGVLRD